MRDDCERTFSGVEREDEQRRAMPDESFDVRRAGIAASRVVEIDAGAPCDERPEEDAPEEIRAEVRDERMHRAEAYPLRP